MINKDKKRKNVLDALLAAINCLRQGQGIVISGSNDKVYALYPAEFLNESEQKKYKTAESDVFVSLAKRAGLLPALLLVPVGKITENWPKFSEDDIKNALLQTGGKIAEIARAKLPIDGAEDSVIISFRAEGDEAVHLALVIGKGEDAELPLVRVHSSCVTGDLLGSLRCDCGSQLKMAISAIKNHGYGVLLYLNQEGRGIGIANKIRAYQLQEQGMDTYEANHALGFAHDERDFTIAASILKALGIGKIKLLSNNPHKVSELRKLGIIIAKREPLITKIGKHNKDYMTAKAKKAGHILTIDESNG